MTKKTPDPRSGPEDRRSSPTEGARFNAGKPRWDLMPAGPLSELVNVFTFGAHK